MVAKPKRLISGVFVLKWSLPSLLQLRRRKNPLNVSSWKSLTFFSVVSIFSSFSSIFSTSSGPSSLVSVSAVFFFFFFSKSRFKKALYVSPIRFLLVELQNRHRLQIINQSINQSSSPKVNCQENNQVFNYYLNLIN